MNLSSYDMFRTPLQFQRHIRVMANVILAIFKTLSPVDTARMQRGINLSIDISNKDRITIRVSVGENIDYAGVTNEEWINRPGKNPNQGWIPNAYESCNFFIQSFLSDPLGTMDELDEKLINNMEEFSMKNIEVIDE